MPGPFRLRERPQGLGQESVGPGAEVGLLGGSGVWGPEPRAVPEWVAEDGEPVPSSSPSRVGAFSFRHKSSSNRRWISLGMGRRGACAGGGDSARKGCLSEPAPSAAPRVAPELLWVAPPSAPWLLGADPTSGRARGGGEVAAFRCAANSGRVGELPGELGERCRKP